MADASRNDIPPRNPQYPQGAAQESDEFPPAGFPDYANPEKSLPPGDIDENSRLNRSAHAIGYGIGTAFSEVRQVPRRMDEVRWRLRVVGGRTRATASAAALDMMDTATERAGNLRRAAREIVSHVAEAASCRASALEERVADRCQDFVHTSQQRLEYARRRVEEKWTEARRTLADWQREDPVKFLAAVAGAAFVVGAALKFWKESHD